ncbi:MAG: S16 family serine protease, partial [bacterium]
SVAPARESAPDDSRQRTPLPLSSFSAVVTTKTVRTSLGKPRPSRDLSYPEPRSGLARGLAWTETGGVLLPVEATDFSGRGELILTGSLGDVMKESGRIAMSFIRNHSHRFGLDEQRMDSRDIHLHVPQGAIPKDGPSAGIALAVAIVSALTGIAAHPEIAMTGEITLTGRVLPVGGVKEKLLAALRNNVSTVLLPEGNRVDRADLPGEVERGLELRFTDSLMDALTTVFPPSLFEIRSR